MGLDALAIAGSIIGTGLGIYGDLQSAEANKVAGRYNASILEQRANDMNRVADDIAYIGALDAMDLEEERYRQMDAGRATFAAQNVIVGEGSAGIWEDGLQGQIAQDINRLRNNVSRDIAAIRDQQRATREQAAFERWRGETGATAAYIGAAGTLLGGVTDTAAMAYRMGGN